MHLEMAMPPSFTQMSYFSNKQCTAPGQDTIVFPGCRTGAKIYQGAASLKDDLQSRKADKETVLSSLHWKLGLGIHRNYKYKICLAAQSS